MPNGVSTIYKHLKGTVGLGDRKAKSEEVIMDEDGALPNDKVGILERWAGVFRYPPQHEIALDPAISDLCPQRPLARSWT